MKVNQPQEPTYDEKLEQCLNSCINDETMKSNLRSALLDFYRGAKVVGDSAICLCNAIITISAIASFFFSETILPCLNKLYKRYRLFSYGYSVDELRCVVQQSCRMNDWYKFRYYIRDPKSDLGNWCSLIFSQAIPAWLQEEIQSLRPLFNRKRKFWDHIENDYEWHLILKQMPNALHAEILKLKFVEERSESEIISKLNMSESSFKDALKCAIAEMRWMLYNMNDLKVERMKDDKYVTVNLVREVLGKYRPRVVSGETKDNEGRTLFDGIKSDGGSKSSSCLSDMGVSLLPGVKDLDVIKLCMSEMAFNQDDTKHILMRAEGVPTLEIAHQLGLLSKRWKEDFKEDELNSVFLEEVKRPLESAIQNTELMLTSDLNDLVCKCLSENLTKPECQAHLHEVIMKSSLGSVDYLNTRFGRLCSKIKSYAKRRVHFSSKVGNAKRDCLPEIRKLRVYDTQVMSTDIENLCLKVMRVFDYKTDRKGMKTLLRSAGLTRGKYFVEDIDKVVLASKSRITQFYAGGFKGLDFDTCGLTAYIVMVLIIHLVKNKYMT